MNAFESSKASSRGGVTGVTPSLRFARVDPAKANADAAYYSLSDRHVDVWAFSLDAQPDDIDRWLALLSDEERSRAARFARAADRESYLVAHGALRSLLARYCGIGPQALTFAQTRHGKPILAHPSDTALHFNLAHAGSGGLLAVSRGSDVGVDLETARDDVDTLSVARRFFCDVERAAIEDAPPPLRSHTFLRYWVAKEAVLKAQGSGLARPLDAFAIRFSDDGDTAAVAAATDASMACDDWLVHMLAAPPGWHSALCAPRDFSVELRVPIAPDA
jgi:4'-phosphopantetheinyl transferase